jgi:aldehyde:ferredoxin oxidoreductase
VANGYMGQLLNVDLSSGKVEAETLNEAHLFELVGGYGVGARLLLERMPAGVDPLGPENLLGFMTGPLTGTDAITGNRFTVFCKSPLTQTWGDSNCGGTFGPNLKFAGFDGVLFKGAASEPMYLFIDSGKAELRSAKQLWGKDTSETEDILKKEHGDVEVACIGPSGEKLSLIAAIMNDKGRAAGRSGVGAVMGSKRLKAVVVKGKLPIEVAAPELAKELRKFYMKRPTGGYQSFSTYGTTGDIGGNLVGGDAPVANWGGVGIRDLPSGIEKFDSDLVKKTYRDKRYGCWRCPITCGAIVSVKHEGPYKGEGGHQVEYETGAMFGGNILNDDFGSLIKANDICNRSGLDTISAGATVAWAFECFEKGILTAADTDGMELRWGDHATIIATLEKMARREGFGDLLADGVKVAAEKVGRGSAEYAIHIQGQEVPAHDPKFYPPLAVTYSMDATPGRHTQGGAFWFAPGYPGVPEGFDHYNFQGQGELQKRTANYFHVVNAAGLCKFGHASYHFGFVPNFLSAVTGKEWSLEDCEIAGERIANLRHIFNLREGLNPLKWHVPGRLIGNPPFTEGPMAGITIDREDLSRQFASAMQWDLESCVPNPKRLTQLGLGYAIDLLPEQVVSAGGSR